jgi:exosortase
VPTPPHSRSIPIALGALWLHFFWSLVPSWLHGEYYGYGFLVPLLALAFVWRRAQVLADSTPEAVAPARPAGPLLLGLAGLTLLVMIPLRVIQIGDPGWRPPLLLHGLLVTAISHFVLVRIYSWKTSAYFLPVTIFAWSAVPYLGQIEQGLVRKLTGIVIGLTREIFLLGGQPVEQRGETLALGSQLVEVTEGCSGIRSLQSLVMAALFFGELLWLRWTRRLVLIASAMAAAIVCNTARAWYLAEVQFTRGYEAAEKAHDPAGHLAFAASALILYGVARLLMPRARGRTVIRKTTVAAAG